MRTDTRSIADIVIHPVRLRILAEFAGRSMTTRQLAAALPSIPTASLYRHVATLVEAGLVEVVEERAVNGANERVFRASPVHIDPDEFDALDPEDHLSKFSVFGASLVDAFAEYIRSEGPVPSRDGLSYNLGVVHLSQEEFDDFSAAFEALSAEMLGAGPGPGRKRYTVASVVVPSPRRPE